MLHSCLDLGSSASALLSIEYLGKAVALCKIKKDQSMMNLCHRLQCAHQHDLQDLKFKIQNLDRQLTHFKNKMSQCESSLFLEGKK